MGSVGSLGRVGSGKKFAELFPTFDCSLFPVPYSLVPLTPKNYPRSFLLLPAPCSLLPVPYSLFPVPWAILQILLQQQLQLLLSCFWSLI
ncbi:MAG: hypothetical protein F6K56_11695 [Moorea sp. SIO3G5]|nr:hypothetical protein [Moorena sp. SIO3G5]